MRFVKKAKHPINRGFMKQLLFFFICILIMSVGVVFFLEVSDTKDKTCKVEQPQLISTDSCDSANPIDYLIEPEVTWPHLPEHSTHQCKEKIAYKHDTIVIHDTITKYILGIDTIHYKYVDRYVDRVVYVDSCEHKCKYWYIKHFNRHRYPEHGPLWELDSVLECK